MEIIFRKIPSNETPGPGELWIRPRREADQGTCGLALLVRDQGVDALEQGAGPWTRIVVSATGTSPNLDEMLAMSLAQCRLEQRPIPDGFKAIARYAEIARKGLRPSDLPPEKSLEGMFLAVLNFHGDKLDDPQTASRFLAAWQRMFSRLLEAATAGEDPFTTPLFETCHDLAQERAYLTSDQEVYRQDVLRGERWKIKLPGGPDESSALILRQPRSLLFKYWARRDPNAPSGSAYLFLGVEWGKNEWIFSTDPVMRLSLKLLAESLDQAEKQCGGDSWYDGKDHQHTLVASPKGGSKLGETQILRIVRSWTKARPVQKKRPVPLAVASFAAGILLVCAIVLARVIFPPLAPLNNFPVGGTKDTHIVATEEKRPHGLVLKEVVVNGEVKPCAAESDAADLTVLPFFANDVDLEMNGKAEFRLEDDIARPVKLRIKVAFSQPSPDLKDVAWKMDMDGRTLVSREIPVIKNDTVDTPSELPVRVPAKPCSFKFHLVSKGPGNVKAKVHVECIPDPSQSRLHILAIGVSDYAIAQKKLQWAHKDAQSIVETLQNQNQAKKMFADVIVQRKPYKGRPVKGLLTDKEATQAAILHELAGLRESVKEDDLALIFFSGHGKQQERSHHYFFLPYDYDSAKELDASAVSWDAMRRYVVDMPCPAIIILDTCHSGAAGMGSRGTVSTKTELKRAMEEALVHFSKAKRGIGILAACLGDQSAFEENNKWQHGVLTLAILECLTGKRIAAFKKDVSPLLPGEQAGAGVISLHDLYKYCDLRVAELIRDLGYEQAVDLRRFQDLDPRQIPIAAFEKSE